MWGFDRIKGLFASEPKVTETAERPPSKGEIGVYDSLIYGEGDFTPYDPDELKTNKGVDIYERMQQDDQVKAVLTFKRVAIAGRQWYFDVPEDNPEQEEMSYFFETCINRMDGSFSDDLSGILSALHNAYSINEKIWEPFIYEETGKAMWGIKDIKNRPFETFEFKVDQHGNLTGLAQLVGGTSIEIPLDKVIHFVHNPAIDPIFGESDLRACYNAWWSKDKVQKFWNIHLERHASGFVWVKMGDGMTAENKAKWKKIAKNLSSGSMMLVPQSADIQQTMPVNTDAYEARIASCDKAIAKSMLVPNLLGLSEQGNTGSFAQSQTQFDAFMMVLDEIATRLEEALNEQLFRQLAIWNFGTEDFPRFKFKPLNDAQVEAMLKLWADLLQKGAVKRTDTDEAHIRKLLAFPEPAEEPEPDPVTDPEQGPPGDDTPPDTSPGEEGDVPPNDDIPPEDPITVKGGEHSIIAGTANNNAFIESKPEDFRAELTALFAEKPWLNRVDFARLEKNMDQVEEPFKQELSDVLAQVGASIEKQLEKMVAGRALETVPFGDVAKIDISSALKSKYRKAYVDNSNAAGTLGMDQAMDEVAPDSGVKLAKAKKQAADAFKYFSAQSYRATGTMSDKILSVVQNVVFNAIKTGKGYREMIATLKADPDFSAWIPQYEIIEVNGTPTFRAVNTSARAETIARTATSDAINQGRKALFTSDEYKGLVRAFEYSAILDDRTTDVCSANAGKIRIDWGDREPPNHYNCRSVLVPVTIIDEWNGKQSPLTNAGEPQKGFK